MAPSTIKGLLNQKSAECLTHDQLIERLFDNLLEALSETDLYPYEFFEIDTLQGEQRAKMELWHESYRSQLRDIFPEHGDGQLARMALDMNKGALDRCCALIVDNFMKHEKIDADDVVEVVTSIITEKHPELLSEAMKRRIIHNVRESFPAYQSLNNLSAAAPVFGFPIDDISKAEITAHKMRIINGAIDAGVEGPEPV